MHWALGLHDGRARARPCSLGLDVGAVRDRGDGRSRVPMFTRNGVPGTQPRQLPQLERVALGLLIA